MRSGAGRLESYFMTASPIAEVSFDSTICVIILLLSRALSWKLSFVATDKSASHKIPHDVCFLVGTAALLP
jgi:hypothetical protein